MHLVKNDLSIVNFRDVGKSQWARVEYKGSRRTIAFKKKILESASQETAMRA